MLLRIGPQGNENETPRFSGKESASESVPFARAIKNSSRKAAKSGGKIGDYIGSCCFNVTLPPPLPLPPVEIVYPGGTVKSAGVGSFRERFVTVVVVVPVRGSECTVFTSICKSCEYHLSVMIRIGCAFPICPAGIVRVTRVPSTESPCIVSAP